MENNKKQDLLDSLINSPTQKRFKMWMFFDFHLHLYQDFNGCKFEIGIQRDNDNQYNWMFYSHFIFWGIDYSWNSRTKTSNNNWLGDKVNDLLK